MRRQTCFSVVQTKPGGRAVTSSSSLHRISGTSSPLSHPEWYQVLLGEPP